MNKKARVEKVVSQLPTTLQKNTIYYVRVGNGFDIYVTNDSGFVVAYPSNYATISQLGNYVPLFDDAHVGAVKRFTGAYSDWQLNNDVANARGFVQSLPSLFLMGTLNDKDLVLYRNGQQRLFIGDTYSAFLNQLVVPDATLSTHAMNLGQIWQYGLGTQTIPVLSDLDTYSTKSTGFYSFNDAQHSPYNYGTTIKVMRSASEGTEIAASVWGDGLAFRGYVGGAYGSWNHIYHTGNFNPDHYLKDRGFLNDAFNAKTDQINSVTQYFGDPATTGFKSYYGTSLHLRGADNWWYNRLDISTNGNRIDLWQGINVTDMSHRGSIPIIPEGITNWTNENLPDFRIYGLGTFVPEYQINIDTPKPTGFYSAYAGISSGTSPFGYATILHQSFMGSSEFTQIAIQKGAIGFAFRTESTNWSKVYHEGNFNPDWYWAIYSDVAFRGINDNNSRNFSFLTNDGNTAKKINTGGILVSNDYNDQQHIPTNGIYSKGTITTFSHGNSENWYQAYLWGNHATAGYATGSWVNLNFIPKTHPVYNVTQAMINNWVTYGNLGNTLSGFATIGYVEANYAQLGEPNTFTKVNMFELSPQVPTATAPSHAVNYGQMTDEIINNVLDLLHNDFGAPMYVDLSSYRFPRFINISAKSDQKIELFGFDIGMTLTVRNNNGFNVPLYVNGTPTPVMVEANRGLQLYMDSDEHIYRTTLTGVAII